MYVAGGVTASGSAYAGYGNAVAEAKGSGSRLLGYRHDNNTGANTYYFETTVDGSASAEAVLLAAFEQAEGWSCGLTVVRAFRPAMRPKTVPIVMPMPAI